MGNTQIMTTTVRNTVDRSPTNRAAAPDHATSADDAIGGRNADRAARPARRWTAALGVLAAMALCFSFAVRSTASAAPVALAPSIVIDRIDKKFVSGTVTGLSNFSSYRVVVYIRTPFTAPTQFIVKPLAVRALSKLSPKGKFKIPYASQVADKLAIEFAAFLVMSDAPTPPASLWSRYVEGGSPALTLPNSVAETGIVTR